MKKHEIAQGARDWKTVIRIAFAAWIFFFLIISTAIDFTLSNQKLGAAVAAGKILNSIGGGRFQIPTPGDHIEIMGLTLPFAMIEAETLATFNFDAMPNFKEEGFNYKTSIMAISFPVSLFIVIFILFFNGLKRKVEKQTDLKRGASTANEKRLSNLTANEDD